MARISQGSGLLDKLQTEFESNQSYLNLILGLLIVLVAGLLVFNYFKRGSGELIPAEQTSLQATTPQVDVAPTNLPGNYTVKEGDTLFMISEKYYQDGSHFLVLAQHNKLASPDLINSGQVLQIPKLETLTTADSMNQGTGGAVNQTTWGPVITADTYTVVTDDWLSKIAGRAYGDIMMYDKIAKANSIANPDLIEPGMVLKIPR